MPYAIYTAGIARCPVARGTSENCKIADEFVLSRSAIKPKRTSAPGGESGEYLSGFPEKIRHAGHQPVKPDCVENALQFVKLASSSRGVNG